MQAQYEDFVKKYPSFREYAEREEFHELFDVMNQDEALLRMLDSIAHERPALEGVVVLVESFCEEHGINLEKKQARKAVGALCAVCLYPFGYIPVPDGRKKLKKKSGTRFFKKAATYVEGIAPTRKVEMHPEIVEI